jgi:hypothetical protein
LEFFEGRARRADKELVGALLRQVEDLFDIAEEGSSAAVIVLGRDGTFRMLDPGGWSLQGAKEEFGANAVFKVERRGARIRIEACDSRERCLVERCAPGSGNQTEAGGSVELCDRAAAGGHELATLDAQHDASLVAAAHYACYSENQGVDTVQAKRPVYL